MERNETEVMRRTMRYLEDKCGERHVHRNVNFSTVWHKDGKFRVVGADVDVVGVCQDGNTYVCELKDAILRNASKGLGQLLMYRAIVEHGFSEFQGALSLKGEMRERVEKMREKRVIYLLVLPEAKKTQASEQILRKMISYVSDAEPKVDVLYV